MATVSNLIVRSADNIPKSVIAVLAAVAILGIFVVGFDSGQIEQAFGMSSPMGNNNPGMMWLHEFSHDLRHAAGFMCH